MNRWMAEKLKAGRSDKGMTFVELVVGIALLLILLTGVMFFFYFGIRNFRLAQARGVLSQEADKVMEGTVRQLRVATSFIEPPVGGGWVGNPIYFTGDVRGDGTASNVMFYQTSDNKLMRSDSSTGTTVEIADRVTALEFRYYGEDGQPLNPPDSITDGTDGNRTSIKTVRIRLVMERPVPGWSRVSTEKKGTVVIRGELS